MTIAGGHLTSRLGLDHTTTVGGHMTSLRGLARMTTVGGHRTSLMGLNRKMNVGARTERVRGLERVTTLVGTSPRDRRHARTQNGPFLWHHLWAQGSSSARGPPCPSACWWAPDVPGRRTHRRQAALADARAIAVPATSPVALPATPGDVWNYDIASPRDSGATSARSRWWQHAAATAPLPQPCSS